MMLLLDGSARESGRGGDVTIELEGGGRLETDLPNVMMPEIAALMSWVGFDVNRVR